MKKTIILILSIFMLYGCYDYVEINNLVIISGMLIDYKDNNYYITSQIIENENETKINVYTTRGKSIEECLSELSKLSNKDLFISHLKVIILTESTIKNNNDYQDYFLRDSKSKMNFYVYYVDDKYKDEVLNIYKENNGSALYIKDLMEFNNRIFSSSTPLSFLDLIYKQKEYGIDEIYPNLIIKENNEKKVLYLQNIVGFNQNKEKIILDDKEGIFYNMITNNVEKTSLNIPCEENDFTISLNNLKTIYKWTDNTFYIKIKTNGKLSSYECKYNLDSVNTTKKISNLVNNYIKTNINDIVNISVNNKIDFIGMGNYIYKHDKNYFNFKRKNWNNELNKLNIKVSVDTTITSIGEMRK